MINNIVKVWNGYWNLFLTGLEFTLLLSLITVLAGCVIGFFMSLMRMSKWKVGNVRPLSAIVGIFVEIVRGTPLLLQLYFFYFLLPDLLYFWEPSKFTCITIALCLNSAAYVSEIIRAGIQAVDKGQTEAARSLGMSAAQNMRFIILPQAVRNILPALGNELVTIIKESSVCMVIGIPELMYNANIAKGATFRVMESIVPAAVLYFLITFTLSKLLMMCERRMRHE